jgi:filamentous hemagglutinin family protein
MGNHKMISARINLVVLLLASFSVVAIDTSITITAQAQIVRDGSLGQPGSPLTLTGPHYLIDSTLGEIRSNNGTTNLFHSFSQFNVLTLPSGVIESATFTNSQPVTINNILSRVTGSTPSSINGLLASDIPGANLFLINPNGILFGSNASLDIGASIGQPGSFHVSTADYLRLGNPGDLNAGIFHADLTQASILTSAPVSAFGFLSSPPTSITMQGSFLQVTSTTDPATNHSTGQTLSVVGGPIRTDPVILEDGSFQPVILMAPSGKIALVSIASPGEVLLPTFQAAKITGNPLPTLGSISLNGTFIDVSGNVLEGDGHAGTVLIRGGQFAMDLSAIQATTSGSVSGEATAVLVDVTGGDISLRNSSSIGAQANDNGAAGALEFHARNIELTTGSQAQTGTTGKGNAGNITLDSTGSITINGVDSFETLSGIVSETNGNVISAGATGDIHLTADSVNIDDRGTIRTQTRSDGSAGAITLDVNTLTVTNGGTIETIGTGGGATGNVTVIASDSIALSGQFDSLNVSRIKNDQQTTGESGGVLITATNDFSLTSGAQVRNETNGLTGSDLSILANRTMTVSGGSRVVNRINSAANEGGGSLTLSASTVRINDNAIISTTTAGNGPAGDLHIQATNGNLIISGNSMVESRTEQGSGKGGGVVASASDSIVLSGGSHIESSSFASGEGGSITMRAGESIKLSEGASVSASSHGSGNAGNISINAGQQFDMRNSSITTQATQASGGNIDIQAIDQVRLVNSSISTSVLGGSGGGGNISIDPNVVVLQNSQILAQAIQGAGGNITIFTPLFLADSSSLVSASSQFGLNGTVTIQSPTSNLSGGLGPLSSKPSQAQSLLTQRCAALANGQASSFVVAGREQLPADPGGWLTSPIALAGLDTNPFNNETVAKGTSNLEPRTSSLSASDRVSLRRLTPARFLIANFADSEATGCHS